MPFRAPRTTQWAAITGVLLLSTMIAFVFVYPAQRCGRDGIAFRPAVRRLNQLKNRGSTPGAARRSQRTSIPA